MGSYDFSSLLAAAKEAGISGGLLPDMEGEFVATTVNAGANQGGKDQIGVLWKCVGGPNDGASGWENITISPESPKAMGFFFRTMAKFGMDDAFFQRQPQPTIAEMAERIKGHTVQMKVSTRTVEARKPGEEAKQFQQWNVQRVISGPGGIPVGTGVQSPAAVPAPAPVAAPVAAPVPAAAPAAPAALPGRPF